MRDTRGVWGWQCGFALLLAVGACEKGSDDASPTERDGATESDAAAESDGASERDAASESDASLPPTGIFPAVSDPWQAGPFTAVTVQDTGPNGQYTLVRPEQLAPDGVRNPVVVWGNGGGTTPAFYTTTLPHLASHGFVVIAANDPIVNGPMLQAGLDWILEENERADSELYDKLDAKRVGAMGYSNGSLSVYQMIDDPRLVTTIHAAGGIMGESPRDAVLKEPGPTAYFCDGMDTKANCDGDFEVVEVPVFYGTLLGAQHITVFLPPYVERVNGAAVAWFRWYLMSDETQRSVFLGDECRLCQDPNWTVQRKNWD